MVRAEQISANLTTKKAGMLRHGMPKHFTTKLVCLCQWTEIAEGVKTGSNLA